ncbi:MAG: cobalt-precorrin-5B (C(1))-methyltransferase CbiD, partial [Bacteroidales bacterium]
MILILGGTTQGRSAVQVADQSGNIFFYSTKGKLQEVISHNGVRVTGGMDPLQMEQFCQTNEVELLVDAAHPFAEQLHRTVYEVSCRLHIPVIRYEREFLQRADDIIWCDSYSQAIVQMQSDGVRRLLALTGVNTISRLRPLWEKMLQNESAPQCYFRVLKREESVKIAVESGFPVENLIFFRDDFLHGCNGESSCVNYAVSREMIQYERKVLAEIHPDAIITKESGASGFFNEKITAAREAGVKIYAVKRPVLPESFRTVYGPVGLRKQIEKLVPRFFPLRIGYTTGTCATAATKGAIWYALYGVTPQSVFVTLPSLERVELPVCFTTLPDGREACYVVKDSGDDPDITNASRIVSTVELIEEDIPQTFSPVPVCFLQGEGVGRVTLPGLGLEIGEPAINSVPRKMIETEIHHLLEQSSLFISRVNVTISVPTGEELAKRTFNPKLGVVGGISIIGTSGVVQPFSKEAFLDSIKKEIEVAIAVGGKTLVINSGAKSEKAIREYVQKLRQGDGKPELAPQSFIHYGNFIGETISIAASLGVTEIMMGIMIGKAVKLAEGNLDTHSKIVTMNKEFLKQAAHDAGCSKEVYESSVTEGEKCECIIDRFTMARELPNALSSADAQKFFLYLESLCHKHCDKLLPEGVLRIKLL